MKKKAKGRPRKKFGHKNEQVAVRVTPATKATYERAAEREQVDFSDWVRSVLDEAARKVLGDS